MSSDDTDWAVMEPSKVTMDMVVTDVAILAKREKVPTDYVLVSGVWSHGRWSSTDSCALLRSLTTLMTARERIFPRAVWV